MNIYQKCVVGMLGAFFCLAIGMTFYSQKQYLENLTEVSAVEERSGTMILRRCCPVERKPHEYENLVFQWNLKEYNKQLRKGTSLKICTDEEVLSGNIIDVVSNEEGLGDEGFEADNLTVTVAVDWGLTPNEDCWDVVVEIELISMEYAHIYPRSCIVQNAGGYQIAAVYARQKRWGMEYYVHYEDVHVYENNEWEYAIREIPSEGIVIEKAKGRIWEGKCVKIITDLADLQ